MIYQISKPNKAIKGEITLDGSKSISNRLLIIQALCTEHFDIQRISTSRDTTTLQQLLSQKDSLEVFDCGAAGTTFRFLTAFLAFKQGTQILTGSERMKQRPIKKLVDALRALGCNISYLENEGYPPLSISAPNTLAINELRIAADTSSQYITSLLLIAPTLPNGLILTLEGAIVSRPYIEMTLALMQHFGVSHTWEGNTISVAPQKYQARDIVVEADWSAASYYYSVAAFADSLDLTLNGLFAESLQGDAVIAEMGKSFGIETTYTEGGIHLKKNGAAADFFEWDFIRCPDIAQTLAVMCGGLGINGLFTGLETLFIKETDRVAALKNELAKIGVHFSKLPPRFSKKSDNTYYAVEGKGTWQSPPLFPTYEDHRMAMAFAPLAMFAPIQIEDPAVVAKSYPEFWKDFEKLGIISQEVKSA